MLQFTRPRPILPSAHLWPSCSKSPSPVPPENKHSFFPKEKLMRPDHRPEHALSMEARKESYRRRREPLPSPAGILADLFLSTGIDKSARKGPVVGPASELPLAVLAL